MTHTKAIRFTGWILRAGAILGLLYALSLRSYLLFHSAAEFFSIAVAFAIFLIAWNCRKFSSNNYLTFIGVAFLFIGSLDLVHTLAYKGMGVFKGYETDLATQLWIGGRYLHGVSFVLAAMLMRRRLPIEVLFWGFLAVTGLILLSIFHWGNFPVCFVEGEGLTPFKKISELIISGLFLLAIGLLWFRREHFSRPVLGFITAGLVLSVVSEILFVLYDSPYGPANKAGHFLKLVAFFVIYKALVEAQLLDPYGTLFRELKHKEQTLRDEWQRMEAILNTIPDGIYIINQQHEVEYVNPSMERMFGRPGRQKCYQYIADRPAPCPDCMMTTVLGGSVIHRPYQKARNGRFYDTLDAPFTNYRTGALCKLKIIRDVTEILQTQQALEKANERLEQRVEERTAQLHRTVDTLQEEVAERIRTEAELVEKQKQLRTLSMELIYAEERERREIATQLHDSIGPLLSFAKRELNMLAPDVPSEMQAKVRYISDLIGKAVEQTRTLTFDLNSTTLYVLGLEAAIEELAEEYAQKEHFTCEVNNGGDLGHIDQQIQILLYRSVRELFINIAKHSGARHARVDMRRSNGFVQIVVQDDGKGFDSRRIKAHERLKGFGLFSVQERLANIGGSMKIHSMEGKGTIVVLKAPTRPQEE